jgi:AcrR family transcriptional regulator
VTGKQLITATQPRESARRRRLLDAAYAYVLEHGLAGMSLRPLAAATGTSPRVLLYLFGSKDELVREILAKGRQEELRLVAEVLAEPAASDDTSDDASDDPSNDRSVDRFDVVVDRLWAWLAAPERRGTIRLFFEAYNASLRDEPGPWGGFARRSVTDWLDLLADAQPGVAPGVAAARATRTRALLRGLLLDLLACDEPDRLGAAIRGENPTKKTGASRITP